MTASSPVPPLPRGGSTSTARAGVEIDQGKGRVFPCEGCGADLEFHIGQQQMVCPFCGFQKQLVGDPERGVEENDYRVALRRVAEQRAGRSEAPTADDIHEVRCGDCGANVQFVGTLTADECPYCGTPIQLDDVHDAEDRLRVDGVLPFQVDRQKAAARLAEWVRSRWFAPNEFKRRGAKGKFQGVYLPFWTYDAMTRNVYSGERGEHYYVTVKRGDQEVREQRTRWYPASGDFDRFFDDVLVLAGKGLPQKLVDALEPWPLDGCMPFRQEVLAGFLARTYDIELEDGFRSAEQRIEVALRHETERRIGGDEQRVHSIQTTYGAMTYKHLLLPCWMLVYKFKGKPYQVVVNAATGEVQGERPWSFWKIALVVLAGLAVVGTIAFFASGGAGPG